MFKVVTNAKPEKNSFYEFGKVSPQHRCVICRERNRGGEREGERGGEREEREGERDERGRERRRGRKR